jgi:hypothetical protein
VAEEQANSISHNSFNENRLYTTGWNNLKPIAKHQRSSSYNLQNDENPD